MPLTASVVVSGVIGAAKLIHGLKKEKQDKAALASLHDPFYSVQPEFVENKNIAEQLATGGLPQATKDYETTESQRGLSSALSSLSQTGMTSPNDVSKLLDSYYRSIQRTGAQDAEQHIKNIQYYMDTNKQLAGEKIKQWTINEYQPYQAKLKELTERRTADQANIWGGVSDIAGAGMAYATGSQNQKMLNSLFGDKTGRVSAPFNTIGTMSPTTSPSNQSIDTSRALGSFGGPSAGINNDQSIYSQE